MRAFFAAAGTIAALELRQRVRSRAWYVLLGVFVLLLLIVTALSVLAFSVTGVEFRGAYSVVVFVVLLLAALVTPALSGNAINGDRESATLAPVQVTLVSTAQLVAGKFLAAVATGLAFAVAAVPFLLVTAIAGAVPPGALIVSILVLIVEIAVIAAIGVGFSGVLARPLFSVATTYLVVAALTVGTLIAFGLGGSAIRSEVTSTSRYFEGIGDPSDGTAQCSEWETYTYETPRFDYVWGFLAANPFVILADATPAQFTRDGFPVDLFASISFSIRAAQLPPELEQVYDGCAPVDEQASAFETPQQIYDRTAPSWFVGLSIQVLLAAGVLVWAWARTRTPARRLPKGTRIA